MNLLFDVHTVLATPEDLEDGHEAPGDAADKLNLMLHHYADQCMEDDSAKRFEQGCQKIWEQWSHAYDLAEIDDADLLDWVDQMVATWDDSASENEQQSYN